MKIDLRQLFRDRKVSLRKVALLLDCTENSVRNKISKPRTFSGFELIRLQESFFPDLTVNELYKLLADEA